MVISRMKFKVVLVNIGATDFSISTMEATRGNKRLAVESVINISLFNPISA